MTARTDLHELDFQEVEETRKPASKLKKVLAIFILTAGFAGAVALELGGCCSGPPECPPVCAAPQR